MFKTLLARARQGYRTTPTAQLHVVAMTNRSNPLDSLSSGENEVTQRQARC